jgi:Family of unknown function (DUF6157)
MCYTNTFIQVALDCPVRQSEIPIAKKDVKTAHLIQYELLTQHPYTYTNTELVIEVYCIHKQISKKERPALEKELLTKEHPCLRASALTKRYGFGAHYNENKKIAIYAIESVVYKKLANDKKIKQLLAMKTKR